MAIIPFSKFNLTISELTPTEAKAVKNRLTEALKNHLIQMVPEADRAVVVEDLNNISIDLDGIKDKNLFSLVQDRVSDQSLTDQNLKDIYTNLSGKVKGNKTTVAELLHFDKPLKDNPALKLDFSNSKNEALGAIINLPSPAIEKINSSGIELEEMSYEFLDSLVTDQTITAEQKKKLDLLINLSRLTGANPEFIKTLQTDNSSILDFIDWDVDKWKNLLIDNQIPIPEGEASSDTYAANLLKNMELTYPQFFLLNRIVLKKDFSGVLNTFSAIDKISTLGEIKYQNGHIILDEINWTGVSEEEKNLLEKQIGELQEFSNSYKHLGIIGILADNDLDIAGKKGLVSKRLEQVKLFYTNNEQIDFAAHDFFNPNIPLDYTGIDEKNRPFIKEQALAFQRMRELGDNTNTTQLLMEKGFSSSRDIVNMGELKFVQHSNLEMGEAKKIFADAQTNVTATTHFLQAIRDTQKGGFSSLAVSNLTSMHNDLREIDGYEDLFGNQDYCECEHCQSIFSPAAYFTDLMLFIDKNVTQRVFKGAQVNHPIKLKSRRPDLWKLPLTCQNTSTEIPYLDVVNDVLEQYIQNGLEEGKELYQELAKSEISWNLPFHLPLEELRIYLGHFGISLFQLYKLLDFPKALLNMEFLALTPAESNLIGTAAPENVGIRFGNPTNFSELAISEVLLGAGIERPQLEELLMVKFLPQLALIKIVVVESTEDIQQFTEHFQPETLTTQRLDMMDRFLRLWRKMDWSIPEFDMVLMAFKGAGIFSTFEEIDDDGNYKWLNLADAMNLQKKLGLTVEELSSLIYELPEDVLLEGNKGFYGRIFNLKAIFGINVDTGTYNLTAELNSDRSEDQITPYLLSGLNIDEYELKPLFQLLGNDISTENVALNKSVLSRLYRHARIAKALKWTVEDLLAAMEIDGETQELIPISLMTHLLEQKKWADSTPFDFHQLGFILDGRQSRKIKFGYQEEKVKKLIDEIKKDSGMDKILVLKNKLQGIFKVSSTQLENDYLPLLSLDIEDPSIAAVFSADIPDVIGLNSLKELINQLERIQLLFEKLKWKETDIQFFISHHMVFGLVERGFPDLDTVKIMLMYYNIMSGADDETKAEIQSFLGLDTLELDETHIDHFSSHWNYSPAIIQSVLRVFPISASKLKSLNRLKHLLAFCQMLGIQGESFIKFPGISEETPETAYQNIIELRDIVMGAFRAKYPEENILQEKLEPYHDRINVLKRDALCSYILAQREQLRFKDRNDLYYFFLLDVEMSGCFRTSKLLAAISSLQFYIHRCQMNLEQSETTEIGVEPGFIPATEWEWRKNYRIWEANRKVFLYPENYIDPTLRNTKTPLFKELENELLQQNITIDTAEVAYKKYMAQFMELANVRYSGAYYHLVDNSPSQGIETEGANGEILVVYSGNNISIGSPYLDKNKTCYYLFARTHLQPYQYHYRTYNPFFNKWGHWEKIDLPIEAGEVSSIISNGNLYVYWTEVQHKEISYFAGGTSKSEKVQFKVTVKYSYLDVNNRWTSPQRLYLGNVSQTKTEISLRLNLSLTDDHINDGIIEKYIREVFRKPYVSKYNNYGILRINHIFTPGRGIENIDYRTRGFSKNFKINIINGSSFSPVNVLIEIPSHEYRVTNSKFSEVVLPNFNVEVLGEIFEGEVKVDGPHSAFGIITVLGKLIEIHLRVEILAERLEEVLLTGYLQNKFQYVHEADRSFNNNIDPNIENTPFFYREYLEAFNNDQEFRHFIEDGSQRFVRRNEIIIQKEKKEAYIRNAINSLPIHQLSTVLTEDLNNVLETNGISEFLSLKTQNISTFTGKKINFNGPYGEYYWEMFFHIPFIIANNLNANQDFKGAKWWYERIIDPTSSEKPLSDNPGEHYWQFRAFRGLDITKLTEILSDEASISIYKSDPFNPHAIARLRISAYQKAIVMKYIDNLLDWGDFLFAQDTQESIVEASMLYQMAQDILGKRPERIGKCKSSIEEILTFDQVILNNASGTDFITRLENVYLMAKNRFWQDKTELDNAKFIKGILDSNTETKDNPINLSEWATLSSATYYSDLILTLDNGITNDNNLNSALNNRPILFTDVLEMGNSHSSFPPNPIIDILNPGDQLIYEPRPSVPTGESELLLLPFCVPTNSHLFQYHDLVKDRLFKIRNCMNISGVKRSLALYQPPIDPMMLVRAKAAGLSLEDVLLLGDEVSYSTNYRFVFVLEKTKQLAHNVQSFGSSLLSAFEKKDGEELMLLRSVHERNILRLSRDSKNKQIREAQKQYLATEETVVNIENRINYYEGLIEEGLTGWEKTQQVSRHLATTLKISEGILHLHAGITYLIPQAGSPFAMTYGGKQLGNNFNAYAEWSSSLASILDSISSSAGLEASYQRRKEEWNFHLRTAMQELKQATQQLLATEMRVQIAEKELEIHEKSIEQASEMDEFFRNKFTNLDLYNYMATSLHRLHRLSYTMALEMAKSAEICFKNELGEERKFIENNNWLSDRAGLLSGENLLFQLNQMEQEYMRLYKRCPEITQSFSLALLNPAELLKLRQTGKCNFKLPEIAFDMMYPGQYRRLIRGVRITIPCIAGPYTNISANLELTTSYARVKPGDATLTEVNLNKNTSICTSSALSDSGTFEFNFRDERYLPFEYAGAISEWELNMPNKIRSFNYDTISDVILQMSYTAQQGDREAGENKVIEALTAFAQTEGLSRLISLRHEFPNEYHVLMSSGNQVAEFDLSKEHFPYFLIDKELIGGESMVFIKPKKDMAVTVPEVLTIDDTYTVNWDSDRDIFTEGNTAETDRIKGGTIDFTGSPIKKWKIESTEGELNIENTDDIILVINYMLGDIA